MGVGCPKDERGRDWDIGRPKRITRVRSDSGKRMKDTRKDHYEDACHKIQKLGTGREKEGRREESGLKLRPISEGTTTGEKRG